MVRCLTFHSPHTSQSSSPAPALPIPSHTSLLIFLSLSLSLLPYAILVSVPNPLPTASLRGTFAPGGCFPHIRCTSSSLSSSHAVPLPSLAMLLYLDSSIGHVPLLHIPNTWFAVLLPYKGTPLLLPPSSCTLYLAGAQTCCPRFLTSSFFLPKSPFVCSSGPSVQTTHICDTCGRLSFPSSFQCMPGYRTL